MNERLVGERLLTPQEVARYLKLHLDTVYRLIRERRLSAVRIGRSYRLTQRDLLEFLTVNSTRPEVRDALFESALAHAHQVGEDVDSDEVLEWLEKLDEEQPASRPTHA